MFQIVVVDKRVLPGDAVSAVRAVRAQRIDTQQLAERGPTVLADLERILPGLGNRGYRVANLEAGVVGGRLYLGAYARGFGATGLTAITDNAALTYLGSLVEGIGPELKYALVAGAVTGGGLTVIANAPNPAGIGILRSAKSFGADGFSPAGLLLGALMPTFVAVVFFWLI